MYVVYSLKGPDWKRNLFLIFLTETISSPDEGQPRPKYIFDKYGTKIYFLFTLQRFGPSPSPNFKSLCLLTLFNLDAKIAMPDLQQYPWSLYLINMWKIP